MLISKKKEQTIWLKNEQRTWIDTFPRKSCRWPIDTWSDVQSSLIIREMPIKTTMRYHLTPVRIADIKAAINNKYWQGCGENRTLMYCCWDCKLIQPVWKNSMDAPQKIPSRCPNDPTSEYVSKRNGNRMPKG